MLEEDWDFTSAMFKVDWGVAPRSKKHAKEERKEGMKAGRKYGKPEVEST